jgi:hypothetical protein
VIDHRDVRERLELAAIEPGGLDRLTAGDTAEAAAIAGHLAGCPTCAEEARRLATLSVALRDVAAMTPPEDLRERTLTLVREAGRPRGSGATVPADDRITVATDQRTADRASVTDRPRPPRRSLVSWPVAIAAGLAIVLIGGGLLGVRLTQELRDQSDALAELNSATLRLAAEPDATLVEEDDVEMLGDRGVERVGVVVGRGDPARPGAASDRDEGPQPGALRPLDGVDHVPVRTGRIGMIAWDREGDAGEAALRAGGRLHEGEGRSRRRWRPRR